MANAAIITQYPHCQFRLPVQVEKPLSRLREANKKGQTPTREGYHAFVPGRTVVWLESPSDRLGCACQSKPSSSVNFFRCSLFLMELFPLFSLPLRSNR